MRQVLSRFKKFGVRLRVEKCSLSCHEVKYLGFTVSGSGIRANDDKIAAIQDAPVPSDLKSLESFLGLVQFYGRFIPNLSTLLHPLNALREKNAEWVWSAECDHAFSTVKSKLASNSVLTH